MEKREADYIIKQYIKPIYGFSINKTKNIEMAEELSNYILLEIYRILLKKNDFIDISNYIFKIAHNVWAKYCKDNFKYKDNICIDNVEISSDYMLEKELIKSEQYGILRREIAFLSKERREIIKAYYYENKKITEIAQEKNIAVGTVKWHLFESKKELKKGMNKIRTIGNLGLNPITFEVMSHLGAPGERGDTKDFFSKRLSQNIAYACYHTPISILEIANELGVSPIFIEDEVEELCEYGFIDLLPNGKYQTNMLINEQEEKEEQETEEIYMKYTNIMIEKYFIKLFEIQKEIEKLPVYYTNRDFNFLMWSLIMYASYKLEFPELKTISFEEVSVPRKDGGNYISQAYLKKDCFHKKNWKNSCGYMFRQHGEIEGMQIKVYWSGEVLDWRDNVMSDYILLYDYIQNNLPQNDRNLESYERLVKKGYLVKEKSGYKANIVYCPDKNIREKLDDLLPKPDKDIVEIAKNMEKELYHLKKRGQPAHIHKIIQFHSQSSIQDLFVYVMKELLDRKLLKVPEDKYKKAICTILFCNK